MLSFSLMLLFQSAPGTPRIGWWLFVAVLILGAILWLNGRRRP